MTPSLSPARVKLTKAQIEALREISGWSSGYYWWRPKTMEKLGNLGLVEFIPFADLPPHFKTRPWRITDLGRQALATRAHDHE